LLYLPGNPHPADLSTFLILLQMQIFEFLSLSTHAAEKLILTLAKKNNQKFFHQS